MRDICQATTILLLARQHGERRKSNETMPQSSGQSRRTSRRRTDSDTSSADSSDLETTSLSSSSDSDEHSSSHCWICSLEPNLSRINTCPSHLALLTLTNLARRQVSRSRAKRRYQSSDSSSSSDSPVPRKRRSMTVDSSVSIPSLL